MNFQKYLIYSLIDCALCHENLIMWFWWHVWKMWSSHTRWCFSTNMWLQMSASTQLIPDTHCRPYCSQATTTTTSLWSHPLITMILRFQLKLKLWCQQKDVTTDVSVHSTHHRYSLLTSLFPSNHYNSLSVRSPSHYHDIEVSTETETLMSAVTCNYRCQCPLNSSQILIADLTVPNI